MGNSSTYFLPLDVILAFGNNFEHSPDLIDVRLLPTEGVEGYLKVSGFLVAVDHVGDLVHR